MTRDETVEAHYRKYRDKLVKTLSRRRPKEDAEDMVQDAYARALTYWGTFNPDVMHFNNWFKIVLQNAMRDFRNNQQYHKTDATLDEITDMMDERAINPEELYTIKEALAAADNLPDLHKQVIYTYVLGYSVGEIANMFPVSKENVWKMFQRFRQSIA